MKLNAEMIANIRAIVEEMGLEDEYEYIGVRVQEREFEIGAIDHVSRVWIDGDETNEELNGVCATMVDAISNLPYEYFGDHVAVVCGNSAEFGEDVGEIIIEDAIVAAVIC